MAVACSLCDKLHKLPADDVVWQFPYSVALLGPWQYYTGYCILVARSHHTELHRMPISERAAFFQEMTLLGQAIDMAFQPRKLNCESLGNQVPHLHWHLFPRRADDPDTLKAVWLALERAECDAVEKLRLQTAPSTRAEIVTRLRNTLMQLQAPSV